MIPDTGLIIEDQDGVFRARFRAMATSCEAQIQTRDAVRARAATQAVAQEAWRIERKFSRYRADNIIYIINSSAGAPVPLDTETALLLSFADDLFGMSGGLFDITSGVLRRAWQFDGSQALPSADAVRALLVHVGWNKVHLAGDVVQLPQGMEIDLGGIAKEYAVDRALGLAKAHIAAPILVNFGGDLAISGPRADGAPWMVAIESVDDLSLAALLEVRGGAIATSGDARRFLVKDGVRYGHILNPRTGWPVEAPFRSITVAAATCLEAGALATLAILQGAGAEAFLRGEGAHAWYIR